MNSVNSFLRLIVLGLWAISVQSVESPAASRIVLVAPFENQSTARCMVTYEVATNADPSQPKRSFSIDRYSESPRAYMENALVKVSGLTVVERQRVDAMMLESDFGAFSGLVDGTAATRLGKMMGANVIVMGTVMRVDSNVKMFNGYGISSRQSIVTASVRVRALDIVSGSVIASEIVEGSRSYPESQFGGTSDSDVAYAVIANAMEKLNANEKFLSAIAGRSAVDSKVVRIEIAPIPTGCDVLVDGKFRGNAPLTLEFPSSSAITLRFEKSGYQPWERAIVPGQVPSIRPELTPQGSNGQEKP